MKRVGVTVGLLLLILLTSGCSSLLEKYYTPVDPSSTEEILFEVPPGASTTGIAKALKEAELIQNANAFKAKVKAMDMDGKMQAGAYMLSPSMDVASIIEKLVSGDVYVDKVTFTIPEGYEVRQIADVLAEKGLIDKEAFLDVLAHHAFDYPFLEGVDRSNLLEGFLFPATYTVQRSATEVDIVTAMLNRFAQSFGQEAMDRAHELGMTVNEVVTLASIIEREARIKEEFPIISSVFHNRLNKEMLLQSCATVQYILKERKPVLSIADTKIDSAYNTYMYSGLPPAPIASPGDLALESALYPADTRYLYFVTKETEDGSHYFNETYEGHMRDVAR